MIRVFAGFRTGQTSTKASSRVGIPDAPFASLRRSVSDDPLPARGDSSPPKRKRKKR